MKLHNLVLLGSMLLVLVFIGVVEVCLKLTIDNSKLKQKSIIYLKQSQPTRSTTPGSKRSTTSRRRTTTGTGGRRKTTTSMSIWDDPNFDQSLLEKMILFPTWVN